MTKKIMSVLIVSLMLLVGLGAGITSIAEDANNTILYDTKSISMVTSQPVFLDKGEFTTIELEQSETYLSKSGKPMLPVVSKTFSFPIGTKINGVTVDMQTQQYHLDKQVTPTPLFIASAVEVNQAELEEKRIDEATYSSAEIYPSEQYTIKYGVGIKDMEHVIFVNVKCFTQYSPANNEVTIPTNIDIDITYETTTTTTQEETYDLIIITHELFEDELQPLVAHKESVGISTKLVTVDEIYADYDGVADWEEIKLYLADHVLDWDTKFVLLAGGHKGQTNDWYVPDFRSHNWDPLNTYDPPYDETYSSDLYYADLFGMSSQGDIYMDTWDSNMNGIYAEGPRMPSGTDKMDFYPDVHLGRIPLRYEWEAPIVVDKIITYENTAHDSWFKKAVLAGGDGFPPERYGNSALAGVAEGEISCDVFAQLLANRGVESTKTYCSDKGDIQVKNSREVYNEISKGAGFVHLTGHASAFLLGSYETGAGVCPPYLIPFYTGFNAKEYDCGYKLPFIIAEGCHNAQFDITGQEIIDFMEGENPNFRFGRDEYFPHDVSSWFIVQEGGGAIAVIGNTGLGLGGLNYGITEFVGGWIMLRFAEAWGVDGEDYTGSVWTTGISGYIDNFDVTNDDGDRKTIEERVLLGDPSVKLGGYGNSLSDPEEPKETKTYGEVSVSAPTWSVGDSWTYALDTIDIDLTPIEGRELLLALSSGDVVLEVTDVTSDTYVTSFTTDDIDVELEGMFELCVEDKCILIPYLSFENAAIDGEIIFDKETLGFNSINLKLILNLAENIESIAEVAGISLPPIAINLVSRLSIPLNLDIGIDFAEPFELLHFPLENNEIWGVPSNTITVTIDGGVESIWLRLLNIVNKFTHIIPEPLAQYLPIIDISDILEDLGMETTYEISLELPYKILKTALFEVWGSESISVGAGNFNAVNVGILEHNAAIYYSESTGNIVKMVGNINEYIPLINNVNLELIE